MKSLGTVVNISALLLLSFTPTAFPHHDNKAPELLWKFDADNAVIRTASIGDGLVFFSCHRGPLYALEATTGKEQWKHESGCNLFSSPVHLKGLVYFIDPENRLCCLDAKTGEKKWSFKSTGQTFCSPAAGEGFVVFGSTGGYIHALDAESGEERWKYNTGAYGVVSTAAIVDGMVYCGGMFNYFYALNLKTGKEIWKFETERIISNRSYDSEGKVKGETRAITPIRTKPLVGNGVVCFGDENGRFFGVDKKTGKGKWMFELENRMGTNPGYISRSEGVIHTGSRDGYLNALDLQNGKVKWRFKTENKWVYSPASEEGLVCFGCRKTFYAVDAKTGEERWRYEAKGEILDSPLMANGMIFFGDTDSRLYALRIKK